MVVGRSTADLAAAAVRRRRALALHLQGASFAQIAEALGYTRSGAHSAVKAALKERAGGKATSNTEAYEVEAARLDVVINALSGQVKSGDVQAIDRYMRAITRRTELAGLISNAGAASAAPSPGEVKTPLDELRDRRAARNANAAGARSSAVADQ